MSIQQAFREYYGIFEKGLQPCELPQARPRINFKSTGKETYKLSKLLGRQKRRKLRKTSVKELLAQEPFKLLIFDCSVMLDTTISLTKLMNMRRLRQPVLHPLVTIKLKLRKSANSNFLKFPRQLNLRLVSNVFSATRLIWVYCQQLM